MAYSGFARWYDALNTDANYDALASYIIGQLRNNSLGNGIVADLGCGTGEVCLRLAAAGYDMIAVDASPDMLGMLREKAEEQGRGDILLLCQDLTELDLYGTIRAAVSTFDTFNHLDAAQLAAALRRASLFTEPGGLLVFDVNTIYKHECVLANHIYETMAPDVPGLRCEWQNRTSPGSFDTTIDLTVWQDGIAVAQETFTEYCHRPAMLEKLLENVGYMVLEVVDGERFVPPNDDTQRLLYTAKRL